MSIRVDAVESFEQLERHRDAYHQLLDDTLSSRSFFFRVEQLRALAPIHAGARRSQFMLLAWRGDTLVGALPLVRETKSWTRAGVRRLMMWGGDGTVMNIEGEAALRGSDAECAATVSAFRSALAGPLAHRFDELELGYLRADSRAVPLLENAFGDGELTDEPLVSFAVHLDIGINEWRTTRSTLRMRRLRSMRRRLERLGTVSVQDRVALTADEFAQIADLHSNRQSSLAERGKHRESPFSDPDRRSTLQAMLSHAASNGHARHRLLFVNDRLAAFWLTFVHNTTMFAWITAMHDDFATCSPGAIVLQEIIEREFALGEVQRIELGAGHTFLKETMATHTLVPRHLRWQPPHRPLARLRVAIWRRLVALRQRSR